MIHLATQVRPPSASWRPPVPGPVADAASARRRRGGRAWPFLSRPPQRSLPSETPALAPARPECIPLPCLRLPSRRAAKPNLRATSPRAIAPNTPTWSAAWALTRIPAHGRRRGPLPAPPGGR